MIAKFGSYDLPRMRIDVNNRNADFLLREARLRAIVSLEWTQVDSLASELQQQK